MAKGRQGISFPLEVGVEGLALGVCGVCALGKDLNIFALGELNLAHAGPSLRHPPGLPTLYASLAISASGYPSSCRPGCLLPLLRSAGPLPGSLREFEGCISLAPSCLWPSAATGTPWGGVPAQCPLDSGLGQGAAVMEVWPGQWALGLG